MALHLIPETYKNVAETLPKLKWSPKTTSRWVSKTTVFNLCGKAYLDLEDGESLFWCHLNMLHKSNHLPRFSSKNEKGIAVCYNKTKKVFSDTWCSSCKNAKSLKYCKICKKAIRFLKPEYKLTTNMPKPSQFLKYEVDEKYGNTSTFKGLDFTRYLLGLVFGYDSEKAQIPLKLQTILLDELTSPMVKMDQLLNVIYGARKDESKNLWIAPTQGDNEDKGLAKFVTLSPENSFGSFGKHKVWGFNAADVYKWHELQIGDLVLFGNKRSGFKRLGTVTFKFIWKPEACYFDSGKWVYGFTLTIQRSLAVSGDFLHQVFGYHHQTQCKVLDPYRDQVIEKLHQCEFIL